MTAAVHAVFEQARRLTAEERAELIHRLNDLDGLLADRPATTLVDADASLADLERS